MKKIVSLPKRIVLFAWRRKIFSLVVVVVFGSIYFFVLKPRFFPVTDGFETAVVSRGQVDEVLILSGEVDADLRASLSFPATGKLGWVGVSEGDEVYRGQALLKMDTTSLNSNLQQARAALRAAEATVDRVHDDVKDHDNDESFTQKETRVAAETAKDRAYEAAIQAEEALRNATLFSPIAGTVTYLAHPVSGVTVVAGQTQSEVVDLKTLYFEVFADQSEVVSIQKGDSVEIVLEPYPDVTLRGVVNSVGVSPNPEEVGVVYGVRVNFTEIDGVKPRLGMTGDATFVLNSVTDVLRVPSNFVQSDSEGEYVLVENGTKKVRVEVGLEGEDWIEIRSGLSEGVTVYND